MLLVILKTQIQSQGESGKDRGLGKWEIGRGRSQKDDGKRKHEGREKKKERNGDRQTAMPRG